jgi:hypothetical protein
MPIATTAVRALPVAPRHWPVRTFSEKAAIYRYSQLVSPPRKFA